MLKRRTLYNLFVGIGSKMILMIIGFLIPKIFIENYGSEVNGLLTSVAQVFAYLGLLEAGVGAATTQALYEPVADDDWLKINSIMNAASKFYRRTGIFYLIGVICTAILYPILVPNPMRFLEVFLIILFSGLGNVFSYFFQSKYIALLNTQAKSYVHVAIGTVISIITQILKVVMISLSVNIVFVYLVYLMVGLLQISILNIYMFKKYRGKLDKCVTPNYKALSQHGAVLVHQISSLVFSNTDVVILTFFTSLKSVSIYSIYNMVVSNLNVLISTVLDSFTAALGLTYNENRQKFDEYYDVFEIISWIVYFSLMTATLLLYRPFIRLYTANADINYEDGFLPVLFVISQLLSMLRMPGLKVMNIKGCFSDTKNRTIIESVINIIISLVAVQFWGIHGVLLGTIVALLYRTIDIIIYSNKYILQRPWELIVKRILRNASSCAGIYVCFWGITNSIASISGFVCVGFVVTIVTVIVLVSLNLLFEKNNNFNIKHLISIIRR